MKLTFIECNNCDSQKGIVMSDTHANCVSCNRPYSLTGTPVFYPIDELTSLEEIAKQQAYDDMYYDVDMYADLPYIDWSTCFDVQNIINLDEWEHYYENKNETVYINKDNQILVLDNTRVAI